MEYNALIREYSDRSLDVIGRTLLHDFRHLPTEWKVRYNGKDIDPSKTSMDDLFCSPLNPLQIYKPSYGFPIKISTIWGQSFEIDVSSSDTVKLLKLKIYKAYNNIPPHAQSLHFGEKMCDLCFLDDYDISPGATVYLFQKHKYYEPYQPNLERIANTLTRPCRSEEKMEPSWTKISTGVNLIGLCPNGNCPSKDIKPETVTVNANLVETLQISLEKDSKILNCTACSQNAPEVLIHLDDELCKAYQIIPTAFLAYNARSVVYCKYSETGRVDRVDLGYNNQSSLYNVPFEGEKLDQLEITTVEPWRSPYCCVYCDTKIKLKVDEFQFPCGHVFHFGCLGFIQKGMKCRVCEVQFVDEKDLTETEFIAA